MTLEIGDTLNLRMVKWLSHNGARAKMAIGTILIRMVSWLLIWLLSPGMETDIITLTKMVNMMGNLYLLREYESFSVNSYQAVGLL